MILDSTVIAQLSDPNDETMNTGVIVQLWDCDTNKPVAEYDIADATMMDEARGVKIIRVLSCTKKPL